jgi:phage terminase small subunit
MTSKQARFVVEYCVDWNGTQAAIRAGFSEKGARVEACRLLTNAAIRAAIEARIAELDQAAEITGARILLELKRVALSNVRDLFDAEGRLLPPTQLGREVGPTVKKVKVVTRTLAGDPMEVEYVHEIELHAKMPALELLGKRERLWADRVVLDTTGQKPLNVRIVHEALAPDPPEPPES